MWQDVYDRAVETAWKVRARSRSIAAAGDAPGDGAFSRLRIRWPAEYQWQAAELWVGGLCDEFQRYATLETADIPQAYPGIVLFTVDLAGERHEIAIDYSDYPVVDPECAGRCALYFKMQHAREGYPWPHVLPGGFVPGKQAAYDYLPRARALRDRRAFVHDVYGRFGRSFALEVRQRATDILREQSGFGYEGGLGTVRYSRSLREIARSRVCVDLPGNGGFCFRLVDYFAVGACVVAYPHRNRMPEPLVDRQHIAYCREDLSDLVDLCEFYLGNDGEREEMCRRSRDYFDRHLHRSALAAYYLQEIAGRLEHHP